MLLMLMLTVVVVGDDDGVGVFVIRGVDVVVDYVGMVDVVVGNVVIGVGVVVAAC